MEIKNYRLLSIKLDEDLKAIQYKLSKNGYSLTESYYILDIYFLNNDTDLNKLKSYSDMSDYVIIRDFNNIKKEVIIFRRWYFKRKYRKD